MSDEKEKSPLLKAVSKVSIVSGAVAALGRGNVISQVILDVVEREAELNRLAQALGTTPEALEAEYSQGLRDFDTWTTMKWNQVNRRSPFR